MAAFLLLSAVWSAPLYGQLACDSVFINFRQSKIDLLIDYKGNRQSLRQIIDTLKVRREGKQWLLDSVEVVGGASPEGSEKFNWWLSEHRAAVLFRYVSRYYPLPRSLCVTTHLGRDWGGLIAAVKKDPSVPYRDETLECLQEIAADVHGGGKPGYDPLDRIKRFKGGVPYRYMYERLFPPLRASRVRLHFHSKFPPFVFEAADIPLGPAKAVAALPPLSVEPIDEMEFPPAEEKKPFYMDLRTDMVKDLLCIPNLGAEFYLGKNWTVVGNWWYAWWKTDRRHRYWRTYGGDLAVRKWFGSAAREKPLTGHHLGLYGQGLLYDFEWGGKGYLSGRPKHNLWEKANWGCGVEYGYALPIGRRWNIDFTAAAGYMGGVYREYVPKGRCYVWQATKKRHWWGPTKLEVSLVWLLGRGNVNPEKGGGR